MATIDTVTLKKRSTEQFDWTTFLLAVILIAIGLISVYSATYMYSASQDSAMSPTFVKQIIAAIVGFFSLFIILFLPERIVMFLAYPFYALSILLLILVLLFGTSTAGTMGWIDFGGFSVQPSEIAKLTTIMAVAKKLSERGSDIRSIRELGITLGLVLLPVILIALQPDVGSSLVFFAFLLGILLWTGYDTFVLYVIVCSPVIMILSLMGTGVMIVSIAIFSTLSFFFRRKILFTVLSVGIFIFFGLASPAVYEKLQPHQQARVMTFINPDSDPLNKGYNVKQSKLAVGSGGLSGKGFLKGTQTQLRYIPKQWTDFIFSVPNEEFGFVGGVTVIILLFSLIWRGVRTAYTASSKFYSIIAIGIAVVILYHTVINIGMAIGLVPVMGIPLPFMSAGGTFLLVNFAMVGLLLNIYRTKIISRLK
jgi:rod shape determining protein RodA